MSLYNFFFWEGGTVPPPNPKSGGGATHRQVILWLTIGGKNNVPKSGPQYR